MKVKLLTPGQPIPGMTDLSLGDFWSWAYSDLLSNANRSVFAEFMVGAALGVVDTPRVEWDAVDFHYRGFGVEVKSSAYVQAWAQTGPSRIVFDIAKKRSWDASTNTSSPVPVRSSDIYVSCLYTGRDRRQGNVLETAAWQFYVAATSAIEQEFRHQKTVALSRIRKLSSAAGYSGLRPAVDLILDKSRLRTPI